MAEDDSRTGDGRRRWQQWREEDARAALAEHAKSGQSLSRFARERGVSLRRLMYWRKRLGEGGTPGFVAVPIPPLASFSASVSRIELAVEGIVVRVREDLDADHLARIAMALARHARTGC
jgi:transposase-like protein